MPATILSKLVKVMVFCPIAHGPCQGRMNCRLWIRGRLLNTDSKLLAANLARFVLTYDNPGTDTKQLTQDLSTIFWQEQGLPNIQRETLIDRYLRAKVNEVESLAAKWLKSPGFLDTLESEKNR